MLWFKKTCSNSLKWGTYISTGNSSQHKIFLSNICSNSLKRGTYISTVCSYKPLNSRLHKPILAHNFLNIPIFAYLWSFLWLFKNCINIHTIPSLDMSLFIRLRLLLQWQFPQSGNSHFYLDICLILLALHICSNSLSRGSFISTYFLAKAA